MKVLVYPNNLRVGGSQITAIDLAAAVRAFGHDVSVLGTPGPLTARADEHGLRVLIEPRLEERTLSRNSVRAVAHCIDHHGFDIVHAYEAVPCLHALYGTRAGRRAALLGTIMAARVPWYLPRSMSLTVGVPRKFPEFRRRWPADRVTLLPPAVDLDEYGATDTPHAASETIHFVLVSRLVAAFKLAPLSLALDTVDRIADTRSVHLTIVGDGPARAVIEKEAGRINGRHRREVVTLVGEQVDPTSFYASADIVLGSGLALIRGMACGKPCVALGRDGFCKVVDRDSIDEVAYWSFYGRGDANSTNVLIDELRSLVDDERRRQELGRVARQLAGERFDLVARAKQLSRLYDDIGPIRTYRVRSSIDMGMTTLRRARYLRHEARLKREATAVGHSGDRADAYVYINLADRLASRPAGSSRR